MKYILRMYLKSDILNPDYNDKWILEYLSLMKSDERVCLKVLIFTEFQDSLRNFRSEISWERDGMMIVCMCYSPVFYFINTFRKNKH